MASAESWRWLADTGHSLVVTGYQGRCLVVLHAPAQAVRYAFTACSGCQWRDDTLTVAAQESLWAFQAEGSVLRPRRCWLTGPLKARDLRVDPAGRVLVASAQHNALVAPRAQHIGFTEVWRPDFLQGQPSSGDRCHLNGLGLRDGQARYVSLVGPSAEPEGWRQHRLGGGQVLDLVTSRVVAQGLSMPHSPRWHDGRLWVHDSAQGWLGTVDWARQTLEPRMWAPGFLRGLDFFQHYAIAGLSRLRPFRGEDFPLSRELAWRQQSDVCGVAVFDVPTGRLVHLFAFPDLPEVFDVALVPRPQLRFDLPRVDP